ncbi:hypothetical protein Goshw_029214 [Gossypium schwendimanii]|uniref:(+)-delta-cadinene synthase n=1 Tax=Gossypium schwendimanii TaxID=34291 RepID=A0A7J9NBI8_GOSSC|nr:hypothetical protein [Gossypium schwendimanii]
MLVTDTDKSSQKLHIIDAVQRLGVAYHFEKEIEDALQIIYHCHCNHIHDGDDLYTTAVRFRLLREHGFNVDCGYPLSTQIANALMRPLRKSLQRLVARSYNSIYEGYGTQDKNLMKFAKLDFNLLQHLHKEEINEIYRWDINCIDQLPDYMKLWYSKALKVYKDMEDLMSKEGKPYRVRYAIEAMKQQSQVFFIEAKWFHGNYIPTMEEYMPIALLSYGYLQLAIASFVGMEDGITKETFNWAVNEPKIIRASNIICRLMSDIAGHKVEQERGHVSSAVECYMKQYGVWGVNARGIR